MPKSVVHKFRDEERRRKRSKTKKEEETGQDEGKKKEEEEEEEKEQEKEKPTGKEQEEVAYVTRVRHAPLRALHTALSPLVALSPFVAEHAPRRSAHAAPL